MPLVASARKVWASAGGGATLLVLLLTLYLTQVQAWGPLTHYYFARQAFATSSLLDTSIKQGCDFPDGTYFANWSEFPNCDLPVDNFHNGLTAGYFYQFAVSPAGQKFKTTSFDPVSLTLGYGSHMISDIVGFYSGKGYLGTVPSYVTFFPFMTAIDALVSTLSTFPPNELWGSEETSAFLAACTSYYNSVNSAFPVFNTTQVANCALPWADTDVELVELANLQARTGYYQSALVFYDLFNATTFEEASNHFKLSNGCAVSAIQYWANQLRAGATPEQAYTNTLTQITSNFNSGNCYPSSLPSRSSSFKMQV